MKTIPEPVGTTTFTDPLSPGDCRHTGRAVTPGDSTLREVELFDARPSLNRREEIVTAENSTLRFLPFARIALDADAPGYAPIESRLAADEEALWYVNRGSATFAVGGEAITLERGDVLYAPIGQRVETATHATCDLSEFRAAECRLLFGDTYLENRGGVGSYPPHFHGPEGPHGLGADAKEELYHYRCASDLEGDRPFVLQDVARPEDPVGAYVHVFDDQAINVTPGYHDSMAPPAVAYMFTWCLASFTENNRDWARVLTKPGFEDEW